MDPADRSRFGEDPRRSRRQDGPVRPARRDREERPADARRFWTSEHRCFSHTQIGVSPAPPVSESVESRFAGSAARTASRSRRTSGGVSRDRYCAARKTRSLSHLLSPRILHASHRRGWSARAYDLAASKVSHASGSPALEPAHALLRGAVREGFRSDDDAGLLLHAVIADRRGGAGHLLDLARRSSRGLRARSPGRRRARRWTSRRGPEPGADLRASRRVRSSEDPHIAPLGRRPGAGAVPAAANR